jgi:hypothetical protein
MQAQSVPVCSSEHSQVVIEKIEKALNWSAFGVRSGYLYQEALNETTTLYGKIKGKYRRDIAFDNAGPECSSVFQ